MRRFSKFRHVYVIGARLKDIDAIDSLSLMIIYYIWGVKKFQFIIWCYLLHLKSLFSSLWLGPLTSFIFKGMSPSSWIKDLELRNAAYFTHYLMTCQLVSGKMISNFMWQIGEYMELMCVFSSFSFGFLETHMTSYYWMAQLPEVHRDA